MSGSVTAGHTTSGHPRIRANGPACLSPRAPLLFSACSAAKVPCLTRQGKLLTTESAEKFRVPRLRIQNPRPFDSAQSLRMGQPCPLKQPQDRDGVFRLRNHLDTFPYRNIYSGHGTSSYYFRCFQRGSGATPARDLDLPRARRAVGGSSGCAVRDGTAFGLEASSSAARRGSGTSTPSWEAHALPNERRSNSSAP